MEKRRRLLFRVVIFGTSLLTSFIFLLVNAIYLDNCEPQIVGSKVPTKSWHPSKKFIHYCQSISSRRALKKLASVTVLQELLLMTRLIINESFFLMRMNDTCNHTSSIMIRSIIIPLSKSM